MEGRAFEVNTQGQVVWEFINHVDEGLVGIVEEVTRYPARFAAFYNEPSASRRHASSRCAD